MSRPALLGALCLAALALAYATLPRRSLAYTTDPARIAAMTRSLLPGAQVPAGFHGTLGVDDRLVVLGGKPGQLLALMRGTPEQLAAQVGGQVLKSQSVRLGGREAVLHSVEPDLRRYLLQSNGVAVLIQGPSGSFPQDAMDSFLANLK